ncbi:MAG: hypothetical protein CM15mP100_1950 [Alphaproteobacteria bacterium]|nr:MAG: hypothetical protein CM15mP100_1950 [Alphaproteobacteria bacterium]
MTQFDLTPFYRSSIGLDRMAHLMDSLAKTTQGPSQPNWPPYNIEKEGEATYRITMAVAGFSDADLEITLHEQVLTITGIQPEENDEAVKSYIAALQLASLNAGSSWMISSTSRQPN